MLYQLKSSDLARMAPAEKERAWSELLVQTRTTNGSTSAYFQDRIRAFEIRYEMTTVELLERLRLNPELETADIAKWLFLAGVLKSHDENQARP